MEDASKSKDFDDETTTFEDAYRELERLVSALESGRGDLESALVSYERGVRLARLCREKLQGAARRIEMIKGLNDDGELVTEQVDEQALTQPVDAAGRQMRATNAKRVEERDESPRESDVPPPRRPAAKRSHRAPDGCFFDQVDDPPF